MKRIFTIVIVVLVIGLGAFGIPKLFAKGPAEKTQYKIAKVETGTVKKTVSATGILQPWSFVDIKSKAGGRVDQLRVDVGSKVKKGDVIAMIDPSDTQLQVDQAGADIQSADARIKQSIDQLELQKKQSKSGVDTATAAYETAKANLDAAKARLDTARFQKDAQPGLSNANLNSAKANLENTEKQLAEMRDATLTQERAQAQSAADQANANLRNAEANLARQVSLEKQGFVSKQVVDSSLANRDVAKAQYESAKRKLDTIGREQAASEASMVARVAQARAQYENAKAQMIDVEVRKSTFKEAEFAVKQNEKLVENAKASLELAVANLANVEIRRSDILTAKATRSRADAGFKNAKTTLDQTTVTSPSDGVILKKYVEQGTIISSALSFAATGNNIVQIGDVTRMYVDVTVDETDIASVDVGQAVDITIESYPSASVEGKVTRIDPQALVESNVTNIHVRVELDSDAPIFRLLKPGMNATCEFVKGKKEGVTSIPNEALRTDDKGSYVELAIGGKPAPADPKSNTPPDPNALIDVKTEKREIKIGLEGNESVEVVSGLNAGDQVVTQKIEPVVQQAGGAMGSSRMGGFGGGRR